MLKRFFVILAIALAIFLVLCWIYFPSVSRYRELKLEEEKINKKIQEIDSQIKALTDERTLLQTDVTYLEKVIREELGFVKPGEIVYELITKKHPSATANEPHNLPSSGANVSTEVPKLPKSAVTATDTSVSVMRSVAAIASTQKSTASKKRTATAARH